MECEPELQALLRPESHSIFIRKSFNLRKDADVIMYNFETIAFLVLINKNNFMISFTKLLRAKDSIA